MKSDCLSSRVTVSPHTKSNARTKTNSRAGVQSSSSSPVVSKSFIKVLSCLEFLESELV